MRPVVIIGYSGHAYVAIDALHSGNIIVAGYFDREIKMANPFHIKYFGSESASPAAAYFGKYAYFIAIGDNSTRQRIQAGLMASYGQPINAIHPKSAISRTAPVGYGVLVAANATINALANIGNGVICNTGCIIEHECMISDFVHIAPGAVLAGNVKVGERTFIGANSVVKQGVTIGSDVTIGAGSVVIRDVPEGAMIAGNPAKAIKSIMTVNQ